MKYFIVLFLFLNGCASLQNTCEKLRGTYQEDKNLKICVVSKGDK